MNELQMLYNYIWIMNLSFLEFEIVRQLPSAMSVSFKRLL